MAGTPYLLEAKPVQLARKAGVFGVPEVGGQNSLQLGDAQDYQLIFLLIKFNNSPILFILSYSSCLPQG